MKQSFKIKNAVLLMISFILVLFFSSLYFVKKHDFLQSNEIRVMMNIAGLDAHQIHIRPLFKGNHDYSYEKSIDFALIDQQLSFSVDDQVDQFRVYLDSTDNVFIRDIKVFNEQGLLLPEVTLKKAYFTWKGDQAVIYQKQAYLESKKLVFQLADYQPLLLIGLITGLILIFSYLLIKYGKNTVEISILDVLNTFFIFSIFAPHPYYNVFFILALLGNVLSFFKHMEWRKAGALMAIIGIYVLYLIGNDLWFNGSLKMPDSNFELYILYALIPIFVLSIKSFRFLKISSFTVVFVMLFMFSTSLLNYMYNPTLNLFSFDALSKYVHPIYFSYFIGVVLLSFTRKELIQNAPITLFMLLSLMALGSKLILSFVLIWILVSFKRIFLPILLALVLVIYFFQPIKDRFSEILNTQDLSIIQEKYINNPKDPRINGLTIRLILWETALELPQNAKEKYFGIASNEEVNERMEKALIQRGLINHKHYSTHNEFLRIYLEMGMVGVFLLVVLILSLFLIAIKQKNYNLLTLLIFFVLTMTFESHQHRVLGVYLFLFFIYASIRNYGSVLALQKSDQL